MKVNNHYQVIVSQEFVNIRLDKFLVKNLLQENKISRQQWINFINDDLVFVNSKSSKSSYLLRLNDKICIDVEAISKILSNSKQWDDTSLYKIEIIHQDEHKMILNKPARLPVYSDKADVIDLKSWLLRYYPYLSQVSENAGIVHRLDANTTGLIIVAKTANSFNFYQQCLAKRLIKKYYLTWLNHHLSHHKVVVNAPIAHNYTNYKKMIVSKYGKPALSYFYVLDSKADYDYCLVQILSGRTHQIRVHAAYLNCPVVNDHLYATFELKKLIANQQLILLHAYALIIPQFNQDGFESYLSPNLPDYFKEFNVKHNAAIDFSLPQKIINQEF